ncbi:MAG TPA: radical SAM protein [Thermodesulfobacteriota bacterium]|nr:radical SAM protein [Thermodesulfobacteriota bacterium]
MMNAPFQANLAISVEKEAPANIAKASFPLRYGKYSEIRTSDYEFIFNLNGEIKFIRGLHSGWPHPSEQLKRTEGNDWVFYSVGDKSGEKGVKSWLGEYYLPCLPYPSNPVWEVNYLSNPSIMNAFGAWGQLYADLYMAPKDRFHPRVQNLIGRIMANNDMVLHERSKELHRIIGGGLSVLPPDTRQVDYEVIPLNIADGCLYHCKFCCVKSPQPFQVRTDDEIIQQILELKRFYGQNLENYNALFLGNHDALAAGETSILFAASQAYREFDFGRRTQNPFLFLFGSVDSLLHSNDQMFEKLSHIPFYIYINVGLESMDPSTLKRLGKPLDPSRVSEAFQKMLDINNRFENLEITANFVMGEGLSEDHYESLKELIREFPNILSRKGGLYLSPLKDSPKKRELLPIIERLQNQSTIPIFIYLIQRL